MRTVKKLALSTTQQTTLTHLDAVERHEEPGGGADRGANDGAAALPEGVPHRPPTPPPPEFLLSQQPGREEPGQLVVAGGDTVRGGDGGGGGVAAAGVKAVEGGHLERVLADYRLPLTTWYVLLAT